MQSHPFKLGSTWEEVKEKLKEINIKLTDEDLNYEEGQEEALLQRLQQKLNTPKPEIRALIESISYNKGKAG